MRKIVKVLESIVPVLEKNGLFDKYQNAFDKIGSIGQEQVIADDFNDLLDKLTNAVKSMNSTIFSIVEMSKDNQSIVIGNSSAPLILIPQKNLTKDKEGKITKFWVGIDCDVNSDSAKVSKNNGEYRLYDNIDSFIKDLKGNVNLDDSQKPNDSNNDNTANAPV